MMLLIAVTVFFWREQRDDLPPWARPVPSPAAVDDHPHGGAVRIAVATPPELVDKGVGGDTLRQLVAPRLFDAQPDGTWRASLVVPGSDRATREGTSASFRLREASWSNGTPITVEDLRRTADARFVRGIDGPSKDGRITVHFAQRFPGWRQLWSGSGGISPPDESLSGGPFVVQSVVSGFETVLRRNDRWFGDGPFLDEVRLQYVPDSITARQLLARGDVELVRPVADTVRERQFEPIDAVSIDRAAEGGQWTSLQFNQRGPTVPTRTAALAAFPRRAFVRSLLADEASLIDDFVDGGSTWSNDLPGGARLDGVEVTITSPIEHPLSRLVDTSFTRAVTSIGGSARDRLTDTGTVLSMVEKQTFDVAFVSMQDGPELCWQCRFASFDSVLAARADAGDEQAALALERRVRDEGIMLPLWRDTTMVAWRSAAVSGVRANGYVSGDAWAAHTWWRP